jgi:hypothetical protein
MTSLKSLFFCCVVGLKSFKVVLGTQRYPHFFIQRGFPLLTRKICIKNIGENLRSGFGLSSDYYCAHTVDN